MRKTSAQLGLPPAPMRFTAIANNIARAHTTAQIMGIQCWMENSELDYGEALWNWYGQRLCKLLHARRQLIEGVTRIHSNLQPA